MKFYVMREHLGDKMYKRGDTREADAGDVKHLLDRGVLSKEAPKAKTEQTPKNKAEKAPKNKAEKVSESAGAAPEDAQAGDAANAGASEDQA